MLSKKLTPPTAGIDTLLWARRRFLATSLLPPEFSWFFLSSSFMVHPFLSIERRMSEGSYVKRQRSQLLVEDVTVSMRALVGLIPFVPLAPACSRDGDEHCEVPHKAFAVDLPGRSSFCDVGAGRGILWKRRPECYD